MATSNKLSSTTAPATIHACHLFRAPAELRDHVYELCFTENYKEVNLRKAKPPSKAILLTCNKIYKKARLMQRRAYRTYWSKTRFFLRGPKSQFPTISSLEQSCDAADQEVISLDEEVKKNLAHISYLRVPSAFDDHSPRSDGRRPRLVLRADDKLLRHAWIFANGMSTCWIPDHSVSRPTLRKHWLHVWVFSSADFRDIHERKLLKKMLYGGFRCVRLGIGRGGPVNGHFIEMADKTKERVRQVCGTLGPQVLSTESLAIALAK